MRNPNTPKLKQVNIRNGTKENSVPPEHIGSVIFLPKTHNLHQTIRNTRQFQSENRSTKQAYFQSMKATSFKGCKCGLELNSQTEEKLEP